MKSTMVSLKYALLSSILIFSWSIRAQQLGGPSTLKTFQVFIDRDADPGTGFNPVMNDGATAATGVEILLTVTVDAGPDPRVVMAEAQLWDGNNDFLPPYFSDASGWPVGINNGTSASDVVEAYIPLGRLGVTQNVNFFIQSGAPGGPFDIVGPALFMFSVPIPTLSEWMLVFFIALLLTAALWFLRRQRRATSKGLLALFAVTILFGATCNIFLDGQIGDWTDPELASDPANDAGEDAIDILAFFTCYDTQNLFVRFDVAELENQGPVPGTVDVTLFEDVPTPIALTASDVNGDPLLFTINTNPANGILGTIISTGPNSAEVTYTPNPDYFGPDSFTFTVDDQNGGSAVGTATITVDPVNDSPSFTAGAPVSVSKDTGPQVINGWATAISAGPANESGQNLTFQVIVTSGAGVFAVPPAIDGTTGDLSFTPDADANGSATLDIQLMDDGGTANGGTDTSPVQTVAITIGAVNDAPVFTAGADQTHNEDDGAVTVNGWATGISPGPPDEAGQILTFNTVVTANPGSIFAVAPAIDAATGNLAYTLAADAFGVATVEVTLMDDGGTANGGVDTSPPHTLTITVNPVNDAPSFTNAGNVNVFKGGSTETIAGWASMASVGPANESGQSLTGYTVMVISDVNSVLSGTPAVNLATGDLQFTTTADNNGTATISVTLVDDGGTANGGTDTSAAAVIDIIVGTVNDAPSFAAGADQTHNEDDGAITVNGWATGISPGPPDEAGQILTFNTVVTTNPGSIFSVAPAIDAATGNLAYTLAADAFGVAMVEVTLMDDGGTANGGVDTSSPHTLTITVNPVNDAPSFTNTGNVNVFKGGGTEAVAGWATMPSTGPANESGQSLTGYTVMVISDVNSVLSGTPAVNLATGDLQFTTTADNNGTATISVTLMDDGGTANGGTDTSTAAVIDIIAGAVNDAPSFTAGPNITVNEDAGLQSFAGWATDISAGPPDEAGQMLTFNVTGNTNMALFSTPPAVDSTTGTLTFETAPGANTGTPATPAVITLELMDDGGTANGGIDTSPPQMFTITVTPVNSPPVASDDSYDMAVHTRLEVGVTTAAPGHKIAGSVLSDGTADSDPDGPGPLIVTGTSNLTAGAILNMNADGTFTLIPPSNTTSGTVTFDYTISDQDPVMPLTDTATVTITLHDPVWYVKNDHPGPSQGTSENPFQTLAEAEAAAGAAHKIFVFTGDGTVAGQNAGITLQNGQSLIGERVDLVLDINGTPSTVVTGSGVATAAPQIGNTMGDVVTLADDNTVRGLVLLPTASAGVAGIGTVPMKQASAKNADRIQKYLDRVQPQKRAGGTTLVSEVLITPSGNSDGLVLLGQEGNFSFANSEISGLPGNTGTGLLIEFSTATFTLDSLDISNTQTGISLGNNSSPSSIDFTNTNLSACSRFGILIDAEGNDVSFAANCTIQLLTGSDAVGITGTGRTISFNCPINNVAAGRGRLGININGSNPTVNFAAVTIDASAGTFGLQMQNLGATSDINFNGVLDINGAGLDGIFMGDVNGTVDISNSASDIANGAAFGVSISGGSPKLTMNGSLTNNDNALFMTNVDANSTTAFNGIISQSGSQTTGVQINNVDGNHHFESLAMGTPPTTRIPLGLFITNSPGTFTFVDFDLFSFSGVVFGVGDPTINILPASTIASINCFGTALRHSSGTLTGTFTNIETNLGNTGSGIQLTSPAGGTIEFQDITITTGDATGILSNTPYSLSFNPASTISFQANGGLAMAMSNTALSGEIDRVTVFNGDNGGLTLDGNTGSLSFGLVDITTNGGTAFFANSTGTLEVTDPMSSIDAAGGTALEMNTVTIGANNMTFASINAANTGAGNEGIDLDTITGGTLNVAGLAIDTTASGSNGIDINGSTATFNFSNLNITTAANTGVNLTSNFDAMNVNGLFSFSNMDIDTTTGNGFSATMGGRLAISGTNTIDSTTGTALNLDTVLIEDAGLSFQSINTDGAVNGMRLANTVSAVGGISVTGTGADDSGGNIQNATGDGVFLQNVFSVTLTDMQFNNSAASHINAMDARALSLNGVDFAVSGSHGINGNLLADFNMTNCTMDQSGDAVNEHGVQLANALRTTTITSTDFTRSATSHIAIRNTFRSTTHPTPPDDIITIDDCSFSIPVAGTSGSNISIESGPGSHMRLVLEDTVGQNTFVGGTNGVSTLTNAGGRLDVVIDNIDVQGVTGTGIHINGNGAAPTFYDIRNCSIFNTGTSGISITGSFSAALLGVIDNNTVNGVTTGHGIQVITQGGGDMITTLSNNNIDQIEAGHGIRVQAFAGDSRLEATIHDNDVDLTAGMAPAEGISIEAGSSMGGDLNTICLNLFDNTSASNGEEGYQLRQRAGTFFNLQNFAGTGNLPADITTWVNTTKSNVGTVQVDIDGTGFLTSPINCLVIP